MVSVRRSARAPMRKLIGWGWASVLTLLVAGCSESAQAPFGPSSADVNSGSVQPALLSQSAPSPVPLLLRHDPTQPQPTTFDTSFVAVRGEGMTFRLFFDTGNGSDRLVDFDLGGKSLFRYPAVYPPDPSKAGQLFQPGDQITIGVHVDPVDLAVTFSPHGLEFNPKKPARLELSYQFADPDIDGDGIPDPQLEPEIDMWKQEVPGGPWIELETEQDLLFDKIRADIESFTRYAAAI